MTRHRKACRICGTLFPSPPSESRVTCSPACAAQWRRMRPVVRAAPGPRWTTEAVRQALHDTGSEKGRAWRQNEWAAAHRRPTRKVIVARWGSWAAAWTAAGYPDRPPAGSHRRRGPKPRFPGGRDPEKRRAWGHRYYAQYHAQHRPAPQPRPQADPTLPWIGAVDIDATGEHIRCHICGRWFRALASHLTAHGTNTRDYKAEFGLARTTSLMAPATQARFRQVARDLGKGMRLRAFQPPRAQERRQALRLQSRIRQSVRHRKKS